MSRKRFTAEQIIHKLRQAVVRQVGLIAGHPQLI